MFGTSPRTEQRFIDAAALEKAERWFEAVDLYLRVADESGDDLVPADAEKRHLIRPARWRSGGSPRGRKWSAATAGGSRRARSRRWPRPTRST